MAWFEGLNPTIQAFFATVFTWGITALGALMVCFFSTMNKKILDGILGFSAGVMIAAAFWSLLIPAIDLSAELGVNKWFMPTIGFILGGCFVLFSDKFMDKVLNKSNVINKSRPLKRSILLVSAITIHNIPEGLAIGVAFGGISEGVAGMTIIGAVMLAIGIGIQNFPEGAAVALPLRSEGYSKFKSFFIGQASALVEPVAAIVGSILTVYVRNILPLFLSFAAGSMIIVVIRELLPESINEYKNISTIGFMIGFILMMVLDVALG